MHPHVQRLLAHAAEPEQLRGWWSQAEFLRRVGCSVGSYRLHIKRLVEVGVFERSRARGKHEGSLRLTQDALGLVVEYDPHSVLAEPAPKSPRRVPVRRTGPRPEPELAPQLPLVVEEPEMARARDDDPAEIALGELNELET